MVPKALTDRNTLHAGKLGAGLVNNRLLICPVAVLFLALWQDVDKMLRRWHEDNSTLTPVEVCRGV